MKRKNFTLIELLVVIAIIAILASLLLPALNKARDTAKKAKCIGNLKNISQAMALYVDLYEGYLPWQTCFVDAGVEAKFGSYWQQMYLIIGLLKNKLPISSGYSPSGVYRCPAETITSHNGTVEWNVFKGCHYGVNRYLNMIYISSDSGKLYQEFRKMVSTRTPSITYAYGDKGIGINADGSRRYSLVELRARYQLPALRHSGYWNVSMLDGHVETLNGYPLRSQSFDFRDNAWAPTKW